MKQHLLLLVFCGFLVSSMDAQVRTPGSVQGDFERMMILRGDTTLAYVVFTDAIRYRPNDSIVRTDGMWDSKYLTNKNAVSPETAGHIGGGSLRRLPVQLKTTFNSGYARSMNNGPLWYGKGLTQEMHAGFQWSRGILDVTIQPALYYSQNRRFELPRNPIFEPEYPKSEYGYPFDELIDYVQRFGPDPFLSFHPGQSDVSLRLGNFRTGVSTQNVVVGPSWYNPILLSENAPGFPHLYVQTREPLRTSFAAFEFKQMWGALRESKWFDENPDNDWRYFAGLFVGIQPTFVQGLSIGFNRTFYQRGQDFELLSGDPIVTLYRFKAEKEIEDINDPNDAFDQLASVTARWTYPEVGFEAHFEFALNDFGGSFFGSHPDHSRAYTVGVTQLIDSKSDAFYGITFEITNTSMSKTGFVRPPGSYYIHMSIEQGYTHLGQILGSGMGPAGALGYNLFMLRYHPSGMHGLHLSYQRINEDFYYLYFDTMDRHDFEIDVTYRGVFNLNKVQMGVEAGFARRKNMHMVPGNHINNIRLGLSFNL